MGLWFLIVDTTEAYAVLREQAVTRDTLAVLGTYRSSTAALEDLPRLDPTGTLVTTDGKLWRGVTVRRAPGGVRHRPTDMWKPWPLSFSPEWCPAAALALGGIKDCQPVELHRWMLKMLSHRRPVRGSVALDWMASTPTGRIGIEDFVTREDLEAREKIVSANEMRPGEKDLKLCRWKIEIRRKYFDELCELARGLRPCPRSVLLLRFQA
ncbi:MAG: hypothetical protein J0M24_20185 [Verrucomicrobia bacterium]|nr:hypothetical protein [Verrucomicrobiota bacterium]